jgi:hypothetical protein
MNLDYRFRYAKTALSYCSILNYLKKIVAGLKVTDKNDYLIKLYVSILSLW